MEINRHPMPDETADVEENHCLLGYTQYGRYDDEMEDVDVKIDLQEEIYVVRLTPEVAAMIGRNAKTRGVSTETLVNLW